MEEALVQPWPPAIVSTVSGVRAITLGCRRGVRAEGGAQSRQC